MACRLEWNPKDVQGEPLIPLATGPVHEPESPFADAPDIAALVEAAGGVDAIAETVNMEAAGSVAESIRDSIIAEHTQRHPSNVVPIDPRHEEDVEHDDDDDDDDDEYTHAEVAALAFIDKSIATDDAQSKADIALAEARVRYVGKTVICTATQESLTLLRVDDEGQVWAETDRHISAWYDPDELTFPVLETDIPEPADEIVEGIGGATLALAGLAIKAGLAAQGDPDSNIYVGQGPSGWIPDDAGVIALVEQAVAYAIAALLNIFSLDREQVATIGEQLTQAAVTIREAQQ